MFHRLYIFFFVLIFFLSSSSFAEGDTKKNVKQALSKISIVAISENAMPVDRTVSENLQKEFATASHIKGLSSSNKNEKGLFKVSIATENISKNPKTDAKQWMYFCIDEFGSGELLVSHAHLLWGLFCTMKEEWLNEPVENFIEGKIIEPKFNWITGRDACFGWRRRFIRDYDPEKSVQEFARMGCSHAIVNTLSQPFPLTIHPPGEHYYRYYVSGPDFDQFVETELNEGIYPPEYLSANFSMMKENAALAVKYGLTPGMHVANPRSVPEELFDRYPFLRGPRIDHPYRAYKPRYALTTAHPVVRWHYAEMLTKILKEIPEMGFISTWLNDSGSGFEHTTRLYAGRNGGPYLIREWRTNEEFAEAAANNVIRYYQILRDAARKINPEFRIIAGIRAIPEESDIILSGMENGIDTQVSPLDAQNSEKWKKLTALRDRGSALFSSVEMRINSAVMGVPFPWLTHTRLQELLDNSLNNVQTTFDPPSLAPWDINRAVLRAFQMNATTDIDDLVQRQAKNWVGADHAQTLVEIWQRCDQAVSGFPGVPLYDGYGFIPDRLWVRPLVPDIGKIPKEERAYYEKFILSVFNNPQNVDLNSDMLWELFSVQKAEEIVRKCDRDVIPPLNESNSLAEAAIEKSGNQENSKQIFIDLRDRLVAAKCFYTSLRNVSAWVAGVHGYLGAEQADMKKKYKRIIDDMVQNEVENTKELLALWQKSATTFMPIFKHGETWFLYGDNFGELLQKKIELTEKYKNAEPFIDPNYKWQMPDHFKTEKEVYLKYQD